MPLYDAEFIAELNPAEPPNADQASQGAAQIRNVAKAVYQSFPNVAGPVMATDDDLALIAGAATTGSAAGLVPTGSIFGGFYTTAPPGYLLCDGTAINIEYVDLIALVGANTPDMRGLFLRGTSPNAGTDPDGPRIPGSVQQDMAGPHTHTQLATNSPNAGEQGVYAGQAIRPTSADPQGQTAQNTGVETRPKNMAVTWIIKW